MLGLQILYILYYEVLTTFSPKVVSIFCPLSWAELSGLYPVTHCYNLLFAFLQSQEHFISQLFAENQVNIGE